MNPPQGQRDGPPFLGVLMLDTTFERVVGDVGNPNSYPFATRLAVVADANPTRIVRNDKPDPALTDAFCEQARALQAQGAVGLISSCGFLIHVQSEISACVHIPVIASALCLAPSLRAAGGERPLGIITASRPALDGAAISAAQLSPAHAIVEGLENEPAFAGVFLAGTASETGRLDQAAVGSAVRDAAARIVAREPDVSAIILECGNLPPYKRAAQTVSAVPVYDILDCANLLWAACVGRQDIG